MDIAVLSLMKKEIMIKHEFELVLDSLDLILIHEIPQRGQPAREMDRQTSSDHHDSSPSLGTPEERGMEVLAASRMKLVNAVIAS